VKGWKGRGGLGKNCEEVVRYTLKNLSDEYDFFYKV
jgi:hypothetical protein